MAGTSTTPPIPAPAKSLMELLELEYRAKAIKALLKTQGVTGLDIDEAVGNDVNAVVAANATTNDLTVNGLTRAGKPLIQICLMRTKVPPFALFKEFLNSSGPIMADTAPTSSIEFEESTSNLVFNACASAARANPLDGNQMRLKLLQKYKNRARKVSLGNTFISRVCFGDFLNKIMF